MGSEEGDKEDDKEEIVLTKNQIENIKNWENIDEGKRNNVRPKLVKIISVLPLIRELPPMEAREIVQKGVGKRVRRSYGYTDEDDISDTIIDNFLEELVTDVVSILFNGASEEGIFQAGVNNGIEQTVDWWVNHEFRGIKVSDNLERSQWGFPDTEDLEPPGIDIDRSMSERNTVLVDTGGNYRSGFPTNPPANEVERLQRIFSILGKHRLREQSFVEGLIEVGIENIEVDEIKKRNRDISDEYEIINVIADDYKKAKQTIEKGKKNAKKICRGINITNNENFGPDAEIPEWYQREYIELYREHLEEEGLIPDEEDMPSYSGAYPKIPHPARLRLCSWVDKRAQKDDW
jgi:hypothetical protein